MDKEKLMQLQTMHEHLQQMQQHLQALEKQIQDLKVVHLSLGDLTNVKEGTEILVQLASGIFATAAIKDAQTLRVNVGNGVVVDKSLDDTRQILSGQVQELEKVQEDLHGQMAKTVIDFQSLQEELKKLKENV